MKKGHNKASKIQFIILERLRISWQTKYNDNDCGVFAIFHMDTYMGGDADTWLRDLERESLSNSSGLTTSILYFSIATKHCFGFVYESTSNWFKSMICVFIIAIRRSHQTIMNNVRYLWRTNNYPGFVILDSEY